MTEQLDWVGVLGLAIAAHGVVTLILIFRVLRLEKAAMGVRREH